MKISSRPRAEIEKDVLEYLKSHRILTMATAGRDGEPDATALEYANDKFNVYVSVQPNSRKVQYISENPRVFYEIHDDTEISYEKVKNLKAIQSAVQCEIIHFSDPKFEAAFGVMLKKFTDFKRIPKEKRVILSFKPKKIWFLNYTVKFFHRDELSFE